MIRIKVCGITNLHDAMTCVDAGADALGFIFVEGTPRFVRPEDAAPIVRALQFHGDEPPEDLTGYAVPMIKTIKLTPVEVGGEPRVVVTDWPRLERYRERVAAILLDSAARWSEGESRQPIAWQAARNFAERQWRIVLSAGLTPDNVGRAISTVRPYAVDVNSGVEASPGRKDPDKVWRFVAEARRAL